MTERDTISYIKEIYTEMAYAYIAQGPPLRSYFYMLSGQYVIEMYLSLDPIINKIPYHAI